MSKDKANGNAANDEPRFGHILLKVPVSLEKPVYRPDHVDVHLDAIQRDGLRALFDALHAPPPHRLKSGRYVNRFTDAVRWILEQIGRGLSDGSVKTDASPADRRSRSNAAKSVK